MHFKTVIERVWRSTWRMRSSEIGDGLGGCDRANLEAVIEQVCRCTLRPRWGKFGRVLGGSQWTADCVLKLYSSVTYLATVGM
jgi:hypothetical protein